MTSKTINISGPLLRNPLAGFQDYQSIVREFEAAASSRASIVHLAIDSPGGVFSGCIEAARELRRIADHYGAEIVVTIHGTGCSAAYALAVAADLIMADPTALVGSIGVIEFLSDVTAAERAAGIRTEVVTSGAHKADGHPQVELSDAALQERQSLIDDMAEVFFEFVAERRGLSVADVQGLEGRMFIASRAKELGLIDAVIQKASPETNPPGAAQSAPDSEPPNPALVAGKQSKEPIMAMTRKEILATRPDLSAAQLRALGGVPTHALEQMLDAIPRPGDTARATNLSGHGDDLDREMGMTPRGAAIARAGGTVSFSAMGEVPKGAA